MRRPLRSLGTTFETKIFKFRWFISPSYQNELYHTTLLSKIWDLSDRICFGGGSPSGWSQKRKVTSTKYVGLSASESAIELSLDIQSGCYKKISSAKVKKILIFIFHWKIVFWQWYDDLHSPSLFLGGQRCNIIMLANECNLQDISGVTYAKLKVWPRKVFAQVRDTHRR